MVDVIRPPGLLVAPVAETVLASALGSDVGGGVSAGDSAFSRPASTSLYRRLIVVGCKPPSTSLGILGPVLGMVRAIVGPTILAMLHPVPGKHFGVFRAILGVLLRLTQYATRTVCEIRVLSTTHAKVSHWQCESTPSANEFLCQADGAITARDNPGHPSPGLHGLNPDAPMLSVVF
jgi:hypothetical protein